MTDRIEVLHMARQLAEYAAARQSAVARNVAHADTPGYKQQDLPSFSATYRQAETGNGLRMTRPGHLGLATAATMPQPRQVEGGTVAPNGNSVSLEDEILKSAQIRQQHDMALSVYRTGLGIIRASLGR